MRKVKWTRSPAASAEASDRDARGLPPNRFGVRLAGAVMRRFASVPDPASSTLRERFNRREFVEGSAEERRAVMLEIAHSRYLSERELPIHRFLGLSHHEMADRFRGRAVLELGCFAGGSVVAHAEAYGPRKMYGLDIEEVFLEAARLYTSDLDGDFEFVHGYGESNPLSDASVDVILTQDTLEHVNDLGATLAECFRILSPGGLMFCVFPSFFHPFGNHLTMVTFAPWLHLVFPERWLEAAYREIVVERGDGAYWYAPGNPVELRRRRFLGVNGITATRFRDVARSQGFSIVHRNVVPLFALGRRVDKHPWLRLFSIPLAALASLRVLEELLQHRACYIVQKPPVTWSR